MVGFKIVRPDEGYRGRSYSEWIEEWSNLLVSSSPDYQTPSEMFFLRGNLEYESDKSGTKIIKPGKFYDRTGSLGQTIYRNTALFIPVMTAMFSLNDPYGSRELIDEEDLRKAVRTDLFQGGSMWLRYKSSDTTEYTPVVPDITKHYFETRIFTLRISNQSPLIDKFETALGPGEYETVQGGYFVILRDLPKGKYRFHFGGNGRGYYYTDAVYDITVLPDKFMNLVSDESSRNLTRVPPGEREKSVIQEKEETQEKEKKSFLHLKTEDHIENTSPFQ
jgi:hypothetical protein